jgi:hypothetical protein
MQRIVVTCLAFILAGLFGQILLAGHAAAAECGDVYAGARVGPPPEWTFWADGAACFVRWPVENPGREDELLEQCRNTPGARFVHFEPAGKNGQSICIFKILDAQTAEASQTAAPLPQVEADPQVTAPKSPPAEERTPEKLFEDLEAMVRARNEECLARERADDPLGAGSCWKAGAEAVREFIGTQELPGKGLKEKLAELQATWIARAGQLEGTSEPQKEAAVQIEPSSANEVPEPETEQPVAVEEKESPAAAVVNPKGPDPHRLSATSSCSSATLGSKKRCINAPVSRKGNVYELRLDPGCSSGSIAAIGTTDEKGRCVRKVVSLSPGEEQLVESHAAPTVVDAIAYEPEYVQCYSRRHDNVSCDGKIDYDEAQSAQKKVQQPKQAAKKRVKKQKQARRKKATKVKVATAKKQTKPVKIRKTPQKTETALKVTTNYTRKPDVEQGAKKQPSAGEQKPSAGEQKPSFRCLLFSKLC